MSQILELMRRRISTAEDLYGVVRVMKALAAAGVRQYEAAVESLSEYNHTIEMGLQIALRNLPESILPETTDSNHQAMIVLGSDQGMCGAFNEQIATFTLEQLDATSDKRDDIDILTIGARVVGRLEDSGCQIIRRLPMPSSIAGITPAVHELLLTIEELRFTGGIDRLQIIHHRPGIHVGSQLQILQLLPVDRTWLDRLAARDWDSRSLPTFSMKWHELFSSLIRQYLFVVLYRAFAESLASENANRLSSMQAAERNIEGHLEKLQRDYHQGRQESIQAELLDIVAGFEILTENSMQTNRTG